VTDIYNTTKYFHLK